MFKFRIYAEVVNENIQKTQQLKGHYDWIPPFESYNNCYSCQ